MFSKKDIAVIGVLLFVLFNINLNAEQINRDIHLSDKNYIEGMMYLKGEKGVKNIIKQINNCPYAKCRKSDVSEDNILATIEIKVQKPNYKIAIRKLHKAVKNGNFLAADKLTSFLIKNLNYKSKTPNEYLLKLMYRDLGLDYRAYKSMLRDGLEIGSRSKGCVSAYVYGQVYKNGYLGIAKDSKKAMKLFVKTSENCPKDNFYSLLVRSEIAKNN